VGERAWGHNARLTARDVKRAVLELVQARAAKEGRQVPGDIMEFMDKSDVVFLDAHNRPIEFSRVIIAWEDA
jgi:hypothetical protein